jgi:hypothetical protein
MFIDGRIIRGKFTTDQEYYPVPLHTGLAEMMALDALEKKLKEPV